MALLKKFVVKATTNMLEHSERCDAIVDLIQVAIIPEKKLDLAVVSKLKSVGARIFKLLNGQRLSERHPTPDGNRNEDEVLAGFEPSAGSDRGTVRTTRMTHPRTLGEP